MTIKIIDLSVTLKNGAWEPQKQEITYTNHKESPKRAAELFGLEPSAFPDQMAWATEQVVLSTHSGTHVDAPYHYGPQSGGKPARTIDRVPLEWCFSDGVVLDFTHRKAGDLITQEDVKEALKKIKYTLKPRDIVLIRTDTSKHFGEPNYNQMHPGMSEDATLWLIDQGVKIMGIDAWGWDRPFNVMADEYKSGVKGKLWAAHYAGKKKEYCQIEKLANLDQLPPYGFKVACFPISIEGASGGWTRAVAIIEE
jgi:kynurenine formamidase